MGHSAPNDVQTCGMDRDAFHQRVARFLEEHQRVSGRDEKQMAELP